MQRTKRTEKYPNCFGNGTSGGGGGREGEHLFSIIFSRSFALFLPLAGFLVFVSANRNRFIALFATPKKKGGIEEKEVVRGENWRVGMH